MIFQKLTHSGMKTRRYTRWLFLVLPTCCVLGCGLAQYEGAMDVQQKKQRYAENQNQYLESYKISLPDRKAENSVPRDELFLRPPKRVSGNAEEKVIGDLACFLGTGVIQELWVAAIKSDNPTKFQRDVLDALLLSGRNKQAKTVMPALPPELNFDWIHNEVAGRGVYDAYFFRKSGYLVALVFRTEPGKDPGAVNTQTEYSLGSLRVGPEARSQKGKYSASPSTGKSGKDKDAR